MPGFGLILHLQHLGSNVFLLQGLFGVLTLPANYVAFFAMNRLGRRISQLLFMSLVGIFILTIIFVPQGKELVQCFSQNFSSHTYIKSELCSKDSMTPIWPIKINFAVKVLGKELNVSKF
jgi:hypothetical protein